jgi:hypothetical protein
VLSYAAKYAAANRFRWSCTTAKAPSDDTTARIAKNLCGVATAQGVASTGEQA